MKNNRCKKGFTLIELLVVVLIIGILAAVALPQYKKAVEKSKSAQALTLLKATAQAIQRYHLNSGNYPSRFDELDITIPWTGHTKGYNTDFAIDTLSNEDWSIQLVKDTNAMPSRFFYLYVTRLNGAYKGAFYTWQFFTTDNDYPVDEILCAERKSNGAIFSGDPGDYCQKIIHAKPLPGNQWTNVFTVNF